MIFHVGKSTVKLNQGDNMSIDTDSCSLIDMGLMLLTTLLKILNVLFRVGRTGCLAEARMDGRSDGRSVGRTGGRKRGSAV